MRTLSVLPALLIVLAATPLFAAEARASRFRVQVRGLAGAEELLPQRGRVLKQAASPRVRFSAHLPGAGTVRVQLDRERVFPVQPTVTDEGGARAESMPIRTFRGRAATRSSESSAAAAVYRAGRQDYLFVAFPVFERGSGAYYRLSIPLRKSASKTAARVRRISRRAQPLSFDGDTLAAPAGSPSRQTMQLRAAASPVVDLNLDADREWHRTFGEASNAKITAYVNEAEALYERELGITFNIVRQNVTSSQSFGTTDSQSLLQAYRSATMQQPYYGSADVNHLFTGASLSNNVLGLSYVGTACVAPAWAFFLSRHSSDESTPITFAHELGHILSATHDDNPPASLMASVLNSTAQRFFSAYSKSQIGAFVRSSGACLSAPPVPAATPTPAPPSAQPPAPKATPKPAGPPAAAAPSVTLEARLTRRGVFRAALAISGVQSGCSGQLLAGPHRRKVYSKGAEIYSFAPVAGSQNIATRTKSRPRSDVYIGARVSCPDGSSGASKVVRLEGARAKRKTNAIDRWLRKLGVGLRNAALE